ncbi:MAG: hypothetical protein KIS87_11515 [Phycisphaeraceae bacterium]|nr:hypothetical protein [Phycisphaeraceae bacterium]
MRLNKQRKVYLGLLAVAGLALTADQVFLGASGPQGASAATQSPGELTAGSTGVPGLPAATKNSASAHITGAAKLAQLLDTLARTENLGVASTSDAFAIPQEWLPAAVTAEDEGDNHEGSARLPDIAVSPVPVVTAVMAGGTRPAAIVNGNLMIVGQERSGVCLVAVEPGVAHVRTADGIVHELRVRTSADKPR